MVGGRGIGLYMKSMSGLVPLSCLPSSGDRDSHTGSRCGIWFFFGGGPRVFGEPQDSGVRIGVKGGAKEGVEMWKHSNSSLSLFLTQPTRLSSSHSNVHCQC